MASDGKQWIDMNLGMGIRALKLELFGIIIRTAGSNEPQVGR